MSIIDRLHIKFENSELEKEFRDFYLKSSINYIRFALGIELFLYAIFGILDSYIIPEIKRQVWIIRFFIVCPVIGIFLMLSYVERLQKLIYFFVSIIIIVAGLGIVLMIFMARPSGSYLYYGGLILIPIFGCTFSRILYSYGVISSMVVIITYEIFFVLTKDVPFYIFVNNNFFLLSATFLSMVSGYTIELYVRKNFLQLKTIEHDRSKLLELNKELENLSILDHLTGLYNRRYMEIKVKEAILLLKKTGMAVSFLFMDLDNFKQINDSYGHDFGDIILKEVAHIIKDSLRKQDMAFRYGGDEFCILFIESNILDTIKIGERLLSTIKEYKFKDKVRLNFSGGCLQVDHTIGNFDSLLKKADVLLYKAKSLGKSRIVSDID